MISYSRAYIIPIKHIFKRVCILWVCSIMPLHSLLRIIYNFVNYYAAEKIRWRRRTGFIVPQKRETTSTVLQYSDGQMWKRSTLLYYCMTVSGVNKISYSELLWLAVWFRSFCEICVAADHGVRWPFKREDINTGFMGKLIGSKEKWLFIEVTAKWRWPFRQDWLQINCKEIFNPWEAVQIIRNAQNSHTV